MKEALTSFDLRVLVGELSRIEGAYLDKVYQSDSSFILKFNLPRVGRQEVYVQPGRWIFLGEGFEKPREPPALAQNLRKVLDNALLKRVYQRGFDRILIMEFEKETEYTLVFEMFGRGNIILLRGAEVLHALRYGRWRTREIRRGRAYGFPPEGVNPTLLSLQEFGELLKAYKGPLVKALASGLNLGGLYSEEVCLRAGIPKGRACSDLEARDMEALHRGLRTLLEQLERPSPALIIDREPVDVVPFDLQIYQAYEVRRFDTMSAALQEYVRSLRPEAPRDEAVERLERRISKQEEVLERVEREIAEITRATDYIYSHYQEVASLLEAAREGQGRGATDDAGNAVLLRAEDLEVKLDSSLDVDENARLLYERRKELIERARRVKKAVEESRSELGRAKTAVKKKRPSYKPSKKFWFDAYRWSLSSQGFLILLGRDARSNEKLVKKHLEPGDRYVHADLPGAPSVVVKGGSKADETTLREACRLALAYSKAWNLGLGSGSAYWVKPEQVSKTAESGEYLRTGAFVIRGKRNYFHDLPLALGVGEVEYQGTRRIIATDPEAMEGMSDTYVILQPGGKVDRRALVRRLSESFRVPVEEVDRLLPAGTFHIAKTRALRLALDEG